MKRFLRNIYAQWKRGTNRISWDSNISLNAKLGQMNVITSSNLINSSIGNGCLIEHGGVYSSMLSNKVKVNKESSIYGSVIGSNAVIGSNVQITQSEVGRFTYFAGNNRIFHLTIGSFCSIGENVIIGHADHPTDLISTSPLFYKDDNPFGTSEFIDHGISEFKKTVIGNDVWIGVNAFIKGGVKIHDGAVIGAGAVVTRDVEAYTVVGGVPAKPIKKRFSESIINELLKINWWSLEGNNLKKEVRKINIRLREIDK